MKSIAPVVEMMEIVFAEHAARGVIGKYVSTMGDSDEATTALIVRLVARIQSANGDERDAKQLEALGRPAHVALKTSRKNRKAHDVLDAMDARLEQRDNLIQRLDLDRDIGFLARAARTYPDLRIRMKRLLPADAPKKRVASWWKLNKGSYHFDEESRRYVQRS